MQFFTSPTIKNIQHCGGSSYIVFKYIESSIIKDLFIKNIYSANLRNLTYSKDRKIRLGQMCFFLDKRLKPKLSEIQYKELEFHLCGKPYEAPMIYIRDIPNKIFTPFISKCLYYLFLKNEIRDVSILNTPYVLKHF